MTADSQARAAAGIDGLVKDLPAEVGFAVAGAVALLTALLSAATIHLVLSRPVAVAMALNGPGAGQLAKAVVTLLLAAVRDLASLL